MDFAFDIPTEGRFDAVGFGLNAVDHLCFVPEFPEPDTKPKVSAFKRSAGGQAASAMVLCARLGLRAKYVASTWATSSRSRASRTSSR
jgi:hypothetical protein